MSEQNKTFSALQTAIKMETDGKQFYLKASKESTNDTGKKLLAQLADEEDVHRKVFEQIYEALRSKKSWPQVEVKADTKGLKTLFAQAAEKMGKAKKGPATELDAVKTAIDMENRSYDFYKAQLKTAGYDAEKNFYEALAAQERGHHQVLSDYYEYLKDPAAWFVKLEHPSLDGG